MEHFLEMINITKVFSGFAANDSVNLNVKRGEVHALLGENGAGKSTLMNILYGLYTPTSGQIIFKNQVRIVKSPKEAIALGIGMVHQHFMLIPALTVVENIILGMKQGKKGILDLNSAAESVLKLSKKYGLNIDPHAKVWQLSVGEQQRVEIVKALYRGADLLILDEPTAVLTPGETVELFGIIKQLTSEGHGVIFISHKLNEVMAVSDNITVLRGGKAVGTVAANNTTQDELARMMVGRDVLLETKKTERAPGEIMLRVKDLEVMNKKKMMAVKKVSFDIREGEIFGIAGVDGNGQSELIEGIAGLIRAAGGKVEINGKDLTNAAPKKILDSRLSHIPEDRHLRGMLVDMNLKENAILQSYNSKPYKKRVLLNWKVIGEKTRELIKKYNVRATGENAIAGKLSGGNQQKLVLGRELERDPKILLAVHPTRGLDIGAIEFVHNQIIEQRDRGCAVLMVSTELEEIISMSDRIGVLYEGEFMGIVEAKNANVKDLGLMMAGIKPGAAEVRHQ